MLLSQGTGESCHDCHLPHLSSPTLLPPAGLVAQFKGHVAELLRHPRASTAQRNAMCAEFYGKEFVLFDGVGTQSARLAGLRQLLEGVSTSKKRAIYQHMTRSLVPVMEKAILHPPMVHR